MNTVSIIVPVYNVASYIERCMQSIMWQTFSNIECILIDDCGSDNSMDIANNLVQHYKGPIIFKILHHDHNRGLSAARNTGINAATGDYLFFLDSDDEITPNAISLFVKEAQSHPELEMVIGNVTSEPYNEYYDLKVPYFPYNIINDNNAIRRLFLTPKRIIPVMAWNKLVRYDFVKNNDLFFKEGVLHEDEHWMFFAVKYLKNIAFIKDRTYIHYETPGSIMTSTDLSKRAESIMIILMDFLHNIDYPYSDLQVLKCMNHYFAYNVPAIETPTKRKVKRKLFKKILSHHFYKMALHFLIHEYRNRSVYKLKYELIPSKVEEIINKK